MDPILLTEAVETFDTCSVGPLGGLCHPLFAVELNTLVQFGEIQLPLGSMRRSMSC